MLFVFKYILLDKIIFCAMIKCFEMKNMNKDIYFRHKKKTQHIKKKFKIRVEKIHVMFCFYHILKMSIIKYIVCNNNCKKHFMLVKKNNKSNAALQKFTSLLLKKFNVTAECILFLKEQI